MDDKITNEDLDMMIEEIDSDGSGTVDFDGSYIFFNYQWITFFEITNILTTYATKYLSIVYNAQVNLPDNTIIYLFDDQKVCIHSIIKTTYKMNHWTNNTSVKFETKII